MLNQFKFLPFREFVADHASFNQRAESSKVLVRSIDLDEDSGEIHAMVLDAGTYHVDIDFNDYNVADASCNCNEFTGGCCKHIVRVLVEADQLLAKKEKETIPTSISPIYQRESESFLLKDIHWLTLDERIVHSLTSSHRDYYWYDEGTWLEGTYSFNHLAARFKFMGDLVDIQVDDDDAEGLRLKCSCGASTKKLCYHLAQVLKYKQKTMLLPVFDLEKRKAALQKAGEKYGLNLTDEQLEELFVFKAHLGELVPRPTVNITNVSPQLMAEETSRVLNRMTLPWHEPEERRNILVMNYNPYHQDLSFQIMKAKVTKSGALKSPIEELNMSDVLKASRIPQHAPFYQSDALIRNRTYQEKDYEMAELFAAYRTLVQNSVGLETYLFDNDGGKITPSKLESISVKPVDAEVLVFVNQKGDFYEVTGKVKFDNRQIATNSIRLVEQFFFRYDKQFYFMDSLRTIHLLDYFARNNHRIFVHKGQFETYKASFLDELENHFSVNYALLRKSTTKKNTATTIDTEISKLVYLSESDNYILLTPAIRYGDRELPLFSKRNLYVTLPDGTMEEKPRNEWLERGFSKLIRGLHPAFEEDSGYDFVYMSRQDFLESGWFLEAFEELRNDGVQIFGFSQLSKNRFNEHKPTVTTGISSGIDWFDVNLTMHFGNQPVNLEHVQRAIMKRSSYVELGDGTHGLLPEEWIERFGKFFRTGEIKTDFIRIHKTNFQLIDDLFRDEAIDHQVRETLNELTGKLNDFHSISSVKTPKKLKATLRDYQKEGLNWLHFLDEFGFGGILADDMGLGKTVQIIAYMLSQHEKGRKEANLVVVPTSLIFNWRTELKKFAPHLRVAELWGTKRNTAEIVWNDYDVILISYGTLLSDIEHLRKYRFNLVVLDESQAIKNPNSKRYKAVRLLDGRQHLALTGTPIENNTFDLFAQLSFAMPGLLGSARSFLELYATPIDKFQEDKRAKELQRRIHPFVLRRTKKQVAKELPEKTEMVLFCEMGAEQRKVYDVYRKEFIDQIKTKSDDDIRKNSALILQGMTKLRQICDSPAILGDREDYGGDSAKVDELLDQIAAKKDNHKILVFSQFVSMLNLIRTGLDREGIGYCYLTGETIDRQAQVNRFQNDDDTRVFLISLKAGGTGLNLTEADYVFLVDPWWNPAVENQAIDRAYRIGQDKHVVAIRLVTPDSIEEKILELQSRKRQLAEDIIYTDGSVLKSLSKEDLMQLV